MSANAKTILEWTFTPKTFFEESFSISILCGKIDIEDGKIRGEFASNCFERGQDFCCEIQEVVEGRFLAQQIQNNQKFTLSNVSMSREYDDGRRDTIGFAHTMRAAVVISGSVDAVVRDSEGNIIADTKAERLERHRKFGEQVTLLYPNDYTLRKMLQSYNNALRDSNNILVHLYEIRDALMRVYGTEKSVKNAIGISSTKWSRFGTIANKKPLREGRHRGNKNGLRPINADELAFVKSFARELIEGYLKDQV